MTGDRVVIVRPSWIEERHYMLISELDNKVATALCGVNGFASSFTIVNDIGHPCMCDYCIAQYKERKDYDDVS